MQVLSLVCPWANKDVPSSFYLEAQWHKLLIRDQAIFIDVHVGHDEVDVFASETDTSLHEGGAELVPGVMTEGH